jgi:putative FmdB family regulatory protein
MTSMPLYEYLCDDCGPFTAMRPMAEYAEPHACPDCDVPAPRVLLTPPRLATMSANLRVAEATNERSRHAPQTLSERAAHGAGCACCTGRPSRLTRRGKGGSKSFPTARPWMISH